MSDSNCLRNSGDGWRAPLLYTVGALVATANPFEVDAEVRFTDVADEVGIDYVHHNGAAGRKYLPEAMGAGVGAFDYDADGDLDFYFVNGAPLPDSRRGSDPSNALYRNDPSDDGRWHFAEVPSAGGADDGGYGMGCCLGDYDSDGDLDLYVTNHGPNRLFLNDGDGRFTDVTDAAAVDDASWGSGCAFADYNRDGLVDLYVVNYLDNAVVNAPSCERDGKPYYCHPRHYPAQADILYYNLGHGRFHDRSRQAGIYNDTSGKGLGIAAYDFDLDGDIDIYIANDTTPNFLYRNDDGVFTDIGELTGTAYNDNARAEAGMGVAVGDPDLDGDFDLFVTNFELETNTFYLNEAPGFFLDATYAVGLGEPSLRYLAFGTLFFDYDNDGDEDLFVANGHILTDLKLHDGTTGAEQPDQLFDNDGRGRFVDVSASSGAYFSRRMTSRGVASGDFDLDGDLDLVVTHSAAAPSVLRNDGLTGANWLLVTPRGTNGPHDNTGVHLRVVTGGASQVRQISAGTSYLSEGERAAWFGLGHHTSVDTLEIRWPGGHRRLFTDVPANQRLEVDFRNSSRH